MRKMLLLLCVVVSAIETDQFCDPVFGTLTPGSSALSGPKRGPVRIGSVLGQGVILITFIYISRICLYRVWDGKSAYIHTLLI